MSNFYAHCSIDKTHTKNALKYAIYGRRHFIKNGFFIFISYDCWKELNFQFLVVLRLNDSICEF